MSVFPMSVFAVFAHLVEQLADLLHPLFGATAAAAAIVLFTALVRLLVHPLSRAAARGQKARAALQPKIAELRARHKDDPKKLQEAVLELHAEEKVSPVSGCLPGLLQLPAFFLLYHLFSSASIGGASNDLLAHRLFDAPLDGRWADALTAGGDRVADLQGPGPSPGAGRRPGCCRGRELGPEPLAGRPGPDPGGGTGRKHAAPPVKIITSR